MGQQKRRHCWECLRRCLVCDSTRPACKRCTAAGNACPGYGNVKPTRLTWLAPGTVKSRTRKRDKSSSAEPEPPDKQRSSVVATPRPTVTSPSHPPHLANVPLSRFVMQTDDDVLFYTAEYYNACIYPDLSHLQELGPNPCVYRITPELIRESGSHPHFLRTASLCMALSHRINRIRGSPWADHKAMTERFYQHRGSAIRSLREYLNDGNHRADDVAIAGIVSLLTADAQQAASLDWRAHVEGAINLVQLRGGFSTVAASKILEPQLMFICFVSVMGNTTCPASQISMAREHLAALDTILELSNVTFTSFHMCPPPLFAAIIKINHLRQHSAKHQAVEESTETQDCQLTQEAHTILKDIQDFSPERWADTKPRSREDWVLMGTIYQAAVALYCVSSLRRFSVLPTANSPPSTTQAKVLHQLLAEAVPSPRIQRFTLWPLVVLGVQAAAYQSRTGGFLIRNFVSAQLPLMSQHVGTSVPLTAKAVLERFWAKGGTGGWDACFNQPYAFVTQLAVDTSRLLTSQ